LKPSILTISEKLKSSAFLYSLSSLLKTGGTMLAGIIMIRWVEPEEIGLWQSIWILSSYFGFLQLGVMNGLNREIPYCMGSNQNELAKKLAATGQYFSLILALLTLGLTVIGIYIAGFFTNLTPMQFWGFVGLGIIVSANFYQNYLSVTFRGHKSFKDLSYVYFFDFGLILLLLVLIPLLHYWGIVLYYVLNTLIVTGLMHIYRPIKTPPRFSWIEFIHLIKIGFPIFSLAYFKQISKTFPRLILLSAGGVVAVGYFSPAQAIQTAVILLPNIIAQYIYPQMSFKYGKNNSKKELWKIVQRIIRLLFLFGVPVVIVGWFLLPPFINIFFPRYTESILASQLMLISGLFISSTIAYNAFYSVKAYKEDLFLTITMLVLNSAIPYAFTLFMDPLTGVAVGWLIGNCIFFLLMYQRLHFILNVKDEN
jgi:O-antigen/teichoic acid export membrane protein